MLTDLPSHHLAYLRNAAELRFLLSAPKILPAWRDGRLVVAPVLLTALILAAGLVGVRLRVGLRAGAARAATALALVVAVLAVTQITGASAPQRRLDWLARFRVEDGPPGAPLSVVDRDGRVEEGARAATLVASRLPLTAWFALPVRAVHRLARTAAVAR